jgi:transposase-like protein
VTYKDRKQVASSLKQIYQSISEDEALLALVAKKVLKVDILGSYPVTVL